MWIYVKKLHLLLWRTRKSCPQEIKQTNCNQRKWNWWVNCTKYWCGYICLLQMSIICYRWLVWSLPVWFGWKPIPSVARVTRDEVSGFIKHGGTGCLEDSTQLICSFTFGSVRTRSKSSRIAPMRRILSFHRFYFFLCCQLILDLLRIVFAPIRRWIVV